MTNSGKKKKKAASRPAATAPVNVPEATEANPLQIAEAAAELHEASRAAAATGASRVTRGMDRLATADSLAGMGDVVAEAGRRDFAQGQAFISAAEDLEHLQRAVRVMSQEDVDDGMDLAAMAGQLQVVGEVVYEAGMQTVGAFLVAMSRRLSDRAARQLVQGRVRSHVATAMGAVGEQVAVLGANEMVEGMARMATAEDLSTASQELAGAGADDLAEGVAAMTAADELAAAGAEVARAGAKPASAEA